MATGSGKTTVMGMLAAWSILNKVNDRGDARFSDVVLVVCPNVTIRSRLGELDPEAGEASLYRTRDLVPPHLMPDSDAGPRARHELARVRAAGDADRRRQRAGHQGRRRRGDPRDDQIGAKTTTARGTRYLTQEDFERQVAAGHARRHGGRARQATATSRRSSSSRDALRRERHGAGQPRARPRGRRQAEHPRPQRRGAPRLPDPAGRAGRRRGRELLGDEDEVDEFFKEATVWIDGLDRIHKLRGINFCVDLSATPYFLGRVGQDTNRPFPWVVSDFGLTDAIESGLVKIPQLAVRDTTGAEIPGYFNIWRWILPQADAGRARRQDGRIPKPEAILKWAQHADRDARRPLGGRCATSGQEASDDRGRRCSSSSARTRRSRRSSTSGWPRTSRRRASRRSKIAGLPQHATARSTRSASTRRWSTRPTPGEAKSDETRWMRFTLDTVGKRDWPRDRQGRPIYPEGFEELAEKLERPLHPPGRDVRCIVSVGMLTEGWDCNTVTHIVGLRPFMSQLLCEQVVGRGLRRRELRARRGRQVDRGGREGLRRAVRGDPVQGQSSGAPKPPQKRHHVHALPAKAPVEITFPRVEGYSRRSATGSPWTGTRAAAVARPEPDSAGGRGEGVAAEQHGPAVADRARAGSTSVTSIRFRQGGGSRNWSSTWPRT